ncbi:MAG: hypothetical protein KGZ56_00990 [Dethiobacter sp.]|nr:hypothetical protein [Dethiobacter sp.]MBS3898708.1 hypothetical protein [Dethiobacter sp.]
MLKRVKMLESIGSSEGWAYGCGQTVEIDADLADKWIASGIARFAEEPIEDATLIPPETATLHKARPTKKR